jgi:hypothetical protein
LPIEFAPLGFLLYEKAKKDCSFEAGDIATFLGGRDEFSRIFVPFTSHPRLASDDPLQLSWLGDGYRGLACADGASWSYDEEAEIAESGGAPWPSLFYDSPTQLGYLLSREGEILLVAPGLLVSELADGSDALRRPCCGSTNTHTCAKDVPPVCQAPLSVGKARSPRSVRDGEQAEHADGEQHDHGDRVGP